MSHYYSVEPSGKSKIFGISVVIRGFKITLISASGTFSSKRVDPGTKLLAESMVIKDRWRVLDLGCGYGVLGIIAAKMAPHGEVFMVDINKKAVKLAKINSELNNVRNVKVLWGDLFEPIDDLFFDAIISNPPQAAGRRILEKIVTESYRHLNDNGLLQLVAKHRKGGSSLSKMMEKCFGNVNVLARKSGYRVYVSIKK